MLWLLIGYMFLFIDRPFEVWPVLGEMRLEFFYMGLTVTAWLLTPKKHLTANPLTLAFCAFFLAVLLCGMASPWFEACQDTLDNYYKYFVFYLLLVSTVREEEDLRRLVLAFLAVLFLYMLHSLWEFRNGRHVCRMGINRLIGVDSARDPNAFAATIVLALVFVPVLWRCSASLWQRGFLAAFCALSALCVALTGSRGGFVMMLLWGGVTIWNSPWRWRLVGPALLSAPLLFLALPESLQNRFETIIDPSVGPKNAETSANVRRQGLEVGIKLWQDNPAAGVGPGAWLAATRLQLKAHNMYGQLLGELGTLGAVTFAAVLAAVAVNVRRIRAACRDDPARGRDFLHGLSGALAMGFFLLLFAGTFGHNLFRYTWVWYAAFLVIARECADRRRDAVAGRPGYAGPWPAARWDLAAARAG